jgi:Rv0078B-related antitoxin
MSQSIDPRNIEVVDDDLAAALRQKTPAERIAMTADANETARKLAAAGIRHDHPDWSQRDVEREVARRMLGEAN